MNAWAVPMHLKFWGPSPSPLLSLRPWVLGVYTGKRVLDDLEKFSSDKFHASIRLHHYTLIHNDMLQEAIAAGSYHLPPKTVTFGDVDGAMTRAEHVLEGEYRIGGQEHFYLETNATLAVPKDGDGELEIYSSTQNPTYLQVGLYIGPTASCKLRTNLLEKLENPEDLIGNPGNPSGQ